ncbi:MAG: hypothetical protein ACO2O5_04610 [Candidatus Caldipriscus sp.]
MIMGLIALTTIYWEISVGIGFPTGQVGKFPPVSVFITTKSSNLAPKN